MAKTMDVIKYLKENFSNENYVSVFIAGSKPVELKPQSDLDIFVILRNDKVNKGLDEISEIMDKFILRNKDVKYIFFRGGAIKFEDKGLIHFVIYEDEGDFKQHEMLSVLEKIKDNSDLILGKTVKEILRDVDFNNKERIEREKESMLKNYVLFNSKGYIMALQWVKEGKNWKNKKIKKFPDDFFSEQIHKYYKKNYNL